VEDDVDVWRYAIVCCMPEMTTTFSMEKLEWLGYLPMKKIVVTFIRFDRMYECDGHGHTHRPHDSIGRAYA